MDMYYKYYSFFIQCEAANIILPNSSKVDVIIKRKSITIFIQVSVFSKVDFLLSIKDLFT